MDFVSLWKKGFKNLKQVSRPSKITRHQKVPKTLNGTLYVNGPGMFTRPNGLAPVKHPYDGDGSLLLFDFIDGDVYYRSKVLKTKHRQDEDKWHMRLYNGPFGTKGLLPWFMIKNTSNTSVVRRDNMIYTFSDGGVPLKWDAKKLEPHGPMWEEWMPFQGVGWATAGHSKMTSRGMVYLKIAFGVETTKITVMCSDLEVGTLELDGVAFIHDFVVSEHFIVMVHYPVVVDFNRIDNGIVDCVRSVEGGAGTLCAMAWETGEVTKVACPPGFAYHHVHCVDDLTDGRIGLWSIVYPTTLDFQNMSKNNLGQLYHMEIDIDKKEVIHNYKVCDEYVEFGVWHNGCIFCTSTWNSGQCGHPQSSLLEVDVVAGNTSRIIDSEAGCFYGEPTLIGWRLDKYLASVVYNADDDASTLNIYDLGGDCLAELDLPGYVPPRLHGYWHENSI